MTNPNVPWELQSLDPDQDAPRIMQDFVALLQYMQFELVHTHHIETHTHNLGALASGAGVSLGHFSFDQTFTAVPYVQATVASQVTPVPVGSGELIVTVWNLSATGYDLRVHNKSAGTTVANEHYIVVTAIDSTYDTSGV